MNWTSSLCHGTLKFWILFTRADHRRHIRCFVISEKQRGVFSKPANLSTQARRFVNHICVCDFNSIIEIISGHAVRSFMKVVLPLNFHMVLVLLIFHTKGDTFYLCMCRLLLAHFEAFSFGVSVRGLRGIATA